MCKNAQTTLLLDNSKWFMIVFSVFFMYLFFKGAHGVLRPSGRYAPRPGSAPKSCLGWILPHGRCLGDSVPPSLVKIGLETLELHL